MNDDMSISGWLADDYSANADNTTWTFTIKSNVKFSNGKALTANDVKNSLEWLFENSVRGIEYFEIASIEADGQKLTITTAKAEPILPNKLADPLFSIIDTEADLSEIDTKGPVGTGPFVVESFDTTTFQCVVAKNDNYWNGEVKADKVVFEFTEEQTTLTNGLKGGTYDVVYNVSMNDVGEFESDSNYSISKKASGRTTHGFFNMTGALADESLRSAIMMGIDRETYCKVQLSGQYVAGKALITSSADYGFDQIVDPNAYNLEKAVELLDTAGYKDVDGDGYREMPNGEKLELKFVYYTGRPEQQILVEGTSQEMAKIGIKITPDLHDSSTVMNMLKNGEYDLLCMSINVLNCADPENHMRTYFATGGSYSSTGWNNSEFDALIEQLSTESDTESRKEIIIKAQQLIADDGVAIMYCYPLMNFVMKSNVSGIESTPADYYWVNENTTIQ